MAYYDLLVPGDRAAVQAALQLASAAYQDVSTFATAAQGTKADTALQTLTAGSNISITGTGDARTIAWVAPVTMGTVQSVGLTVPTGLQVTPATITTTGTFAITYQSGYQGYTSAEATKLANISANADVTQSVINAAAAKTPPVDADSLLLSDSAASGALKKLTWANVKATLKTYFDTLYQPLAAKLTALGAQTWAADQITYQTSTSAVSTTALTAFGRSLIDDANAATARGTLGLVIGTDVQAQNAGLQGIAGIDLVANDGKFLKISGGTIVASAVDAGGGMNKDPRLMGVHDAAQPMLYFINNSNGQTQASPNNAAFWTEVTRAGAVVTTKPANNAWSTICDITGFGALTHVIAPAVNGTAATLDFRITIDGVATTISRSNFLNNGTPNARGILGPVVPDNDNFFADTAGTPRFSRFISGKSKDKIEGSGAGVNATFPSGLLSFASGRLFGAPYCYFTSSLKVEVRSSNIYDDSSMSFYHGAIYVLLG